MNLHSESSYAALRTACRCCDCKKRLYPGESVRCGGCKGKQRQRELKYARSHRVERAMYTKLARAANPAKYTKRLLKWIDGRKARRICVECPMDAWKRHVRCQKHHEKHLLRAR